MGGHRVGFHDRPKCGLVKMGVARTIGEKQVANLAVGHDLENQTGLQVASAAGQLFGKGPVLLDLKSYFNPVYIDEFADAPPLPGPFTVSTDGRLRR